MLEGDMGWRPLPEVYECRGTSRECTCNLYCERKRTTPKERFAAMDEARARPPDPPLLFIPRDAVADALEELRAAGRARSWAFAELEKAIGETQGALPRADETQQGER